MVSARSGKAKWWLCGAGSVLALGLASAVPAAPGWSLVYSLQPDRLESFSLELTQVVTTDFEGLSSGRDGVVPLPVSGWGGATVTTQFRGELQRYVARIFRDGTLGLVARLRALDATIERDGLPVQHDLSAVNGRSVSLRVSSRGEVLDSYGWRQLRSAGAGDLLDDAFLQSMVRLPAQVPEVGATAAMTFRRVLPVEDGLRCEQTWILSFERDSAAAPPSCPGQCTALKYAGTIRESCGDRQRGMERTASAETGGRLALTRAGAKLSMYSHHWQLRWQRRLDIGVDADRTKSAVRQSVETTGSLTARKPSR